MINYQKIKLVLGIIALILINSSLQAYTVILKNGSVLRGELVKETNDEIHLNISNNTLIINRVNILLIDANDELNLGSIQITEHNPVVKSKLKSDQNNHNDGKSPGKKANKLSLLSKLTHKYNSIKFIPLKYKFFGGIGIALNSYDFYLYDIGGLAVSTQVSYWFTEYFSMIGNFSFHGIPNTGFLTTITARFHLNSQLTRWRPYVGMALGFLNNNMSKIDKTSVANRNFAYIENEKFISLGIEISLFHFYSAPIFSDYLVFRIHGLLLSGESRFAMDLELFRLSYNFYSIKKPINYDS